MRKFILLSTLVLVALVILYRNRIFLRDPLGRLERNGVAAPDSRVFINYSNDVLIQESSGRQMFVVEHGNRLPGTPSGLTCIQGLLCITPSNAATVPSTPAPGTEATMSNREVSFTEAGGARIHIRIR